MIRNVNSGFRQASRRWAGVKDVPVLRVSPPQPKSRWRAFCEAAEAILSGAFLFGVMIAYGLALPLIKLGLFHYISWKAFKEHGVGTGFVVFAFSCLLIDAGLIWAAIKVAQGDLRIW